MRVRTGYSFKVAVGHLGEVMSRLQEIGWKVAPISDRISTFGFTKWTKLAKKEGLRPIYGVELPVVPQLGAKKPVTDAWTFFAKDDLMSIHKLIEIATGNPGREPMLSYEDALAAKGVIKITGERVLLDEISPKAKDLFIGLSPSTPRGLYAEAKKRKFKFIATSDNYFPRATDKEFYRVALGRRSNNQTYPQHLLSDEEWLQACSKVAPLGTDPRADLRSALAHRDKAFEACRAVQLKASLLVPEKPKTLRAMCVLGAKKLKVDLKDKVYAARLDKELKLIDDKKFEDYFYIIADIIAYAKRFMVVGPARGSSCGSLVCYLLGITTIDPIPFGLIFERFIDVNRMDLPDIDIDFSDKRRQEVFDYVEEKYGVEHVARLGTVGLFKPRSALKTAAMSLRIPGWKVEKALAGLIERSGGDSRALQALEDTLKDTDAGRQLAADHPEVLIANRMEGHPNNASQHAAGIVITEEPVIKYVAVDKRTKSAMCDKKDAEDLNLLKIDALGLTQLSIFERTLELIGEKSVNGFLEQIPLDDQKSFDVLNNGHFAGIFQFEGIALQSITKQVKVETLDDIVAITALARPGPLASGGTGDWVKRKNGEQEVNVPHPLFEPQMGDTLGIVIYQEQVMQIGREIGDLSWEDVTALRKAMSKSLGKEFFDQYGDRFKSAAIKKGIPTEVLTKVWDDLCAYGSWAFNKSHSVAYGMVSYYCCWLKAHYPVEFAAATLDAQSDPMKQIFMLRELKAEGIDYIPVDPELSTDRWEPATKDDKQILVGPLSAIKGIGPKTMQHILDCRRTGKPLKDGVLKRLERAKTDIDSLYPIADAIKRLHPNLEAINIKTTPTSVKEVQAGRRGQVVILALATRIAPRDENEPQLVAKRGHKLKGPTQALNLFVRDDTDEMFVKIDRYKFEAMGRAVVEHGRAGKALYAIKGTVPASFRMISVQSIKFLGDIDIDLVEPEKTED